MGFNIELYRELFRTLPGQACFWSGRTYTDPFTCYGSGTWSQRIAESKGWKTLEMIIEDRGIPMPKFDRNIPESVQAWKDASRIFAEECSGDIHAILGEDVHPDSIWNTDEFPAIQANENINSVTSVEPFSLEEETIYDRTPTVTKTVEEKTEVTEETKEETVVEEKTEVDEEGNEVTTTEEKSLVTTETKALTTTTETTEIDYSNGIC